MANFPVIIFALLPFAAALPMEILNYDAGTHSRTETGMPGQAVEGSYSFVIDGKEYKVTYQADDDGFKAQGDHLPVAPPASSENEEMTGTDTPVMIPEAPAENSETLLAALPVEAEENVAESTELPATSEDPDDAAAEAGTEISQSAEMPLEPEVASGQEAVAQVEESESSEEIFDLLAIEKSADKEPIDDDRHPMETESNAVVQNPSKVIVIPHALPQVIRYIPSYYIPHRPLGSGYYYIY